MTRQEIETALDENRLFAQMMSGKWRLLRRNGRTKTWKRWPHRFRIPVKAGLKSCTYIDEDNMDGPHWQIRGEPNTNDH